MNFPNQIKTVYTTEKGMPNYIQDVLTYQDLEKVSFSNDLKENPADYSQFVNDRVNAIVDESFNYKRAAFEKAHTDLARYMDMEHNAHNFDVRNTDVLQMQEQMRQTNERLVNSNTTNLDNSKRQFEINEYYYYNKLETLFFLQLFFIAVLVMALIIYGQKKGMLTTQLAGYLTLIVLAIVIATGVYRYYYTKNTRDTRLWHRRKFDEPTGPVEMPTLAKCDKDGNVVVDVNAVIPSGVTRCAGSVAEEAKLKAQEINKKLQDSVLSYQQTGQTDALLSLTASGSKGLLSQCGL